MIKVHKLALALPGIALLSACSMFGTDHVQSSRATSANQSYTAGPNYSQPGAAQTGELTPDMMRNVQQALQQQGFYHGQVDGVWGPGTQSAVRGFQQQHNLNATGQLDQDTLAAMNLGPGQDNQRYGSNYNPPPASNPAPASTGPR
jgi:peptidoglycan hydrolase-like protein with peptidoglycan-binding domain